MNILREFDGVIFMYGMLELNPQETKDVNYRKYTEIEFLELFEQIVLELKQKGFPELNNIPNISLRYEGSLGMCRFSGGIYPTEISFHMELLDGKSNTIIEIEDTIRHELAHLVANVRYQKDIDHEDKRFKEIAKELGCNSDSGILNNQGNLQLTIKSIEDEGRTEKYYLYCAQCNTLQKMSNKSEALNFFLASSMYPQMPFCFGDLVSKTKCCQSHYYFVFQAENMLEELNKSGQLSDFKSRIERLLNEKEISKEE